MSQTAVRCTGLSKWYGRTPAVQDIHLELEEGECLALLGPSGCGKTTLLRLIAGFETPDEGAIEVGGTVVAGHRTFVAPEKRRAGIVFQDYALFPHLDVGANVGYGLRKGPGRQERISEMLTLVGLKGLKSRMPHELSGGEQQRVALARALAPKPEVLLLDEPFSNLDADLRARVRAEVKEILSAAGATAIFVTHDQEEALFVGDRVGVMNAGRLEQVDEGERLFHGPASTFVAQFVGVADFIPGVVRDGALQTELGPMPLLAELPVGTSARAMVRPDDMGIRAASGGDVRIAERIFQGTHYLYMLRLSSGATVRVLQDHTQVFEVGAPIEAFFTQEHSLVCFVDGRAAGQVLPPAKLAAHVPR